MKIYLSGSRDETLYRKYVINKYKDKLDLFDPIKEAEEKIIPKEFNWKNYISGEIELSKGYVNKIVTYDKSEITLCNILVAYIRKYSAGTIMEIEHAYCNGIVVFIIDPLRTFRKDIWLRFHTYKFMDSIDECFNHILFLKDQYKS